MTLRLNLLVTPAAKSSSSASKPKEKEKDDPGEAGTSSDGDAAKARDGDAGKAEDGAGHSRHHTAEEKSTKSSHTSSFASRLASFFPSFTPPRAIRPLNEAKALQRGAEAFSEMFLFLVAVAVILGENYRGNRKRKKQRDETEDKVDQIVEVVRVLVEKVARGETGLDWDALDQEAAERRAIRDGEAEPSESISAFEKDSPPSTDGTRIAPQSGLQAENVQLQAAVSLLLRLALKNGWIEGAEALQLNQIMNPGPGKGASSQKPTSTSSDMAAQSPARDPQGTGSSASGDEPNRSKVLEEIALARARALAREVRFDNGSEGSMEGAAGQAESLTLSELMLRAGLGQSSAQEAAPPSRDAAAGTTAANGGEQVG